MNLIHDLETFDNDTNGSKKRTVRVIIEIPKGSYHKYEYNPLGYMTIVRDLDKSFRYPFSYGCLPQTLAGDHDPMDALVFTDEAVYPGTVINCRVLGIVKTIDNGEEDDKLLCVPYYTSNISVNLKKTLDFLKQYKFPFQDGTEIKEVLGPKEAMAEIKKAVNAYKLNKKV